MKRVLVVHSDLGAPGGGQAVAAWALQALSEEYDTTLLTYRESDFGQVNSTFGCELRPDRLRIIRMPKLVERGLDLLPTQVELLRSGLLSRHARRLHAQRPFDALLSTDNELDLGGAKALLYVHYPWAYEGRPDERLTWRHRVPVVSALYPRVAQWLGGFSLSRMRRQVFLANSSFIANKVFEAHQLHPHVVFPPVPGGFPHVPWQDRRSAMVGIGRLSPEKSWHTAVDATDRVRAKGHPLELTLIGIPGSAEYVRELDDLARTRPWFRILHGIPRGELVREVSQHRYGIHAMRDEHFGIGVAELLRAGCLPFVHNSGGPLEIVGGRPELTYDSAEQAADRIVAMIEDPPRESQLRQAMLERAELFTETRFMAEILRHVQNVIET